MPLIAGRYRLGETLGEGGMGKVWQARDEVLQREVAIKEVLLPDDLLARDRNAAHRRTLREARAAARLSHPNVVQVFDVFDVDGRVWIVMAYVPSRSLHEVLRTDGPLDPRRVARIGLDLLAALRAAHSAGVDHRDVKPANVLLADDGRVLLTDFGIATIEGDAQISSSDMLLGSPEYMSPERARYGTAGLASDLWSLGATLYAAVEGHSPFHRRSALATLTALAADEPEAPRQAGPLKLVLMGLLRKDPAHRLNASEAEHLLREATSGAYGHALVPVRSEPSTTEDIPALLPPPDGAAPLPDPAHPSEPDQLSPPPTGTPSRPQPASAASAPPAASTAPASGSAAGQSASADVSVSPTPVSSAHVDAPVSPLDASGSSAPASAPNSPASANVSRPSLQADVAAAPLGADVSSSSAPADVPIKSVPPDVSASSVKADVPGSSAQANISASPAQADTPSPSAPADISASSVRADTPSSSASASSVRADVPSSSASADVPASSARADVSAQPKPTDRDGLPAQPGVPSSSARFDAAGSRSSGAVASHVPKQRQPAAAESVPDDLPHRGRATPVPPDPQAQPTASPARRWLLAAAVAVVAVIAGLVLWGVTRPDSREEAKTDPGAPPASAPGTPSSSPSTSPTAAAPAATATATSKATPSPTGDDDSGAGSGSGIPELPEGWRDYRDRTGFAVYVPEGWTRSQGKSIVYFRDSATGRVLGIDQTKKPIANPVADWRGKADYRVSRGDFPSYREIHIREVDYFQKAADWEFTFNRNGTRQHVNNRGVITSKTQAYGFYWQTPDSSWTRYRDDLQLIFDSFRPAT